MISDKTIVKEKASIKYRVEQKLKKNFYKFHMKAKRKQMNNKILNKDFSILSINCVAGLIYHDLDMEFLTPTINLSFDLEDFVKFLERIEYYLNLDLVFLNSKRFSYPVGKLDDVEIHFVHYNSKEECVSKWESRKRKLNFDNIFIIAHDRDAGDGMYEFIKRFDNLPYENKILFTSKEYAEFSCTKYVKAFKKNSNVGIMTGFQDFRGNRYYESCFDIIDWFNSVVEK